MNQMLNAGLLSRKELKRLHKEVVLSNYQLLDASLEEDTLIVSSHGVGTFSAIFKQASNMGIKPEHYGMKKDKEGLYNFSNEQLMLLIDKINDDFSRALKTQKITKKGGDFDYDIMRKGYSEEWLSNANIVSSDTPAMQMIWSYNVSNEDHDLNERYAKKCGDKVVFRIGHIGGGESVSVVGKRADGRYKDLIGKADRYQNLDSDIGKPMKQARFGRPAIFHRKDVLPIAYSSHDPNLRMRRKIGERDRVFNAFLKEVEGITESFSESMILKEDKSVDYDAYYALTAEVGEKYMLANIPYQQHTSRGGIDFSEEQECAAHEVKSHFNLKIDALNHLAAQPFFEQLVRIKKKEKNLLEKWSSSKNTLASSLKEYNAFQSKLGVLSDDYRRIDRKAANKKIFLSEVQCEFLEPLKQENKALLNAIEEAKKEFQARSAVKLQSTVRGRMARKTKYERYFQSRNSWVNKKVETLEKRISDLTHRISEIKKLLKKYGAAYNKASTDKSSEHKIIYSQNIKSLGEKLEKPYIALEESKCELQAVKSRYSRDQDFLQGEIDFLSRQLQGLSNDDPSKATLEKSINKKKNHLADLKNSANSNQSKKARSRYRPSFFSRRREDGSIEFTKNNPDKGLGEGSNEGTASSPEEGSPKV